uniref:CTP synthase (glutamine hydrolyzing) n=1 Tax=Candidatus Phytoplasma australasiaticum subsp. australasiaticum TaxID=2832407 RepID=A0A7S7JLX8_9MOLU|nr:hypothetical protein H7685_00725 ['Parthenium hysterophorus' phyllody phytoplasma]
MILIWGNFKIRFKKTKIITSSKSYAIYRKSVISERYRQRYEMNSEYISMFTRDKNFIISGLNLQESIVEIIELVDHIWFIGVQFHPEFLSRPFNPHPLFKDFILTAAIYRQRIKKVFINEHFFFLLKSKNKKVFINEHFFIFIKILNGFYYDNFKSDLTRPNKSLMSLVFTILGTKSFTLSSIQLLALSLTNFNASSAFVFKLFAAVIVESEIFLSLISALLFSANASTIFFIASTTFCDSCLASSKESWSFVDLPVKSLISTFKLSISLAVNVFIVKGAQCNNFAVMK